MSGDQFTAYTMRDAILTKDRTDALRHLNLVERAREGAREEAREGSADSAPEMANLVLQGHPAEGNPLSDTSRRDLRRCREGSGADLCGGVSRQAL